MSLISDVWQSFCSLPVWVRIWMLLILVPVNIATLAFTGMPSATVVAILSISGLVFNAIPMWKDRGFTAGMAIPHVIFWMPQIPIILSTLVSSTAELSIEYRYFLVLLLICNMISLIIDIPDSIRWLRRKK